MHRSTLIFGVIISILLFMSSCDSQNDCACKSYEDCIDGDCVIQPNTYLIGGASIVADNAYMGVLDNTTCADTILFIVEPNDEFALYLDVPPVQNINPTVTYQNGNQYKLVTSAPMCRDIGSRYATIDCTVGMDTVDLALYFWTNQAPGVFVDSAKVVLTR